MKSRLGWAGLVAVLCGADAPSFAAAPAFDCVKANGTIEKLLCNDEGLAVLDRKMTRVFAAAIGNLSAADKNKQQTIQRGWIKGRNDCWKADAVRDCVESEYTTRITALQIIGGLVVVPSYVGYVCNTYPAKPFTATFYNNTELPSAVLTFGEDQVIAYRAKSGSGARYQGRIVSFWEHQGEVSVEWVDAKFVCRPLSARSTAPVQEPMASGSAAHIAADEMRNPVTAGSSGAIFVTLQG